MRVYVLVMTYSRILESVLICLCFCGNVFYDLDVCFYGFYYCILGSVYMFVCICTSVFQVLCRGMLASVLLFFCASLK